jgi:succinate dehydrogenase/fumarate reductase flavoprotein subunit
MRQAMSSQEAKAGSDKKGPSTFDQLSSALQSTIAEARKSYAVLVAAEREVERAQEKAQAAQENYKTLVADVTDLQAQFNAALAEALKG